MRKKIEQLPRKELETALLNAFERSPMRTVDLAVDNGLSLSEIPLLQAEMLGFLMMLENPAISYKIIGENGEVVKHVHNDGVDGDQENPYLELMLAAFENYEDFKNGE